MQWSLCRRWRPCFCEHSRQSSRRVSGDHICEGRGGLGHGRSRRWWLRIRIRPSESGSGLDKLGLCASQPVYNPNRCHLWTLVAQFSVDFLSVGKLTYLTMQNSHFYSKTMSDQIGLKNPHHATLPNQYCTCRGFGNHMCRLSFPRKLKTVKHTKSSILSDSSVLLLNVP